MYRTSFYRILIVAGFAGIVSWGIVFATQGDFITFSPTTFFIEGWEKSSAVAKEDTEEDIEEEIESNETEEIHDGTEIPVEREFSSGDHRSRETLEKKVIITPEPLDVVDTVEYFDSTLTVEGVVHYTNLERLKENTPSLVYNERLSRAARIKLDNMFDLQYFAHENPDGKMGSDALADMVGYEYILIGENLAMGNFEDDEDLVNAWMDSPGHRLNILRERYTEIGVAVGEGRYEGRDIWMGVQIFGTPMSDCPSPDGELESRIEDNKAVLDVLLKEILALEESINNNEFSSRREYSEAIERYNSLVETYNNMIKETKLLIERLNAQVDIFNECVQG